MTALLYRSRSRAFARQHGRCFYCGQPMWLGDSAPFQKRFNLSADAAQRFQCTAEHLHPRGEGGRDSRANIVAACVFCNRHRHKTQLPKGPAAYREYVQRRVARGRWGPQGAVLDCSPL